MRFNMKRIMVIIIVLSVLLLQMTATAATTGSKAKTLSLQDAIDTGIANNSSVKLTAEKIFLAERSLRTANTNSKQIKGDYGTTSNERIANAKTEILYPLQKEAALNNLKWDMENTKRALGLDITKLYYQVMLKQQQIDMQIINLDRAKAEYDIKKKHVEAGTLTESSLLSYKITIDEASTYLATLQRDINKQVMDMNALTGLDINQPLNFKKQAIPNTEFYISNIEQLITDVTKSSHSIEKLESDRYLAEKERDITNGYAIVETPDEIDDLMEKVLNLDYSIRDAKLSVEYNIRSGYNNLLNLKDDITIKKLNLDKEIKLLEVAKAKYNVGLINTLEYQKAQADRDSAQINHSQSLLDYFLAVEQFKMDIYPVTTK